MLSKKYLLIIASINLYAADTQLTSFKVHKSIEQEIAHDQGAFQLSYYPKDIPFVVFGQKETGNTSKLHSKPL